MDESQIIAALIAFAKSHPRIAAAAVLWLMLSLGWKAQAKEKRDEWARLYPRPVGALRFALELLPDLLGAGRVLLFGVIRGMASREPSLVSAADSPIMGELRNDARAGEGAGVKLGSDGVAPRETQTPPPSEPGYAEQWVLGVIALAVVVALALSGCSAREQLRRSVEPLGLYEVQHPLHGSCHEVGVRAQSEAINRELVVYGGVCVGRIDAGAVGDAGAVE